MSFLAGLLVGAAAAGGAVWWAGRSRRRLLGSFFSFAAHEINTPITALNMTLLNLLGGIFGEIPPDQRLWLDMMREQVGRLTVLVGELRDLIHLEINKELAMHVEEAQPSDVVAAAARAVERGCQQSGIPLEAKAPEGLPAVRADVDRLQRGVAALLFHARKFRSGGPVVLSASAEAGRVVFLVEYQGPALSAAEAERSLELLFPGRAGRSSTMSATGLGLGIVRAVARRQGGDLTLSADASGRTRLALAAPTAS